MPSGIRGAGGASVPAYFLLTFNKKGYEVEPNDLPQPVTDPHPGLVSTQQILEMIEAEASVDAPFTDVFIVSHGWMADQEDAIASYNSWLAVTKQEKPATLTGPAFRSLIIAIHWPSKPRTLWGHPVRGVPFSTHPDAPASAGGHLPGEPPRPHWPRRFWSGVMFVFPWISFFRMKARAEKIGQRGVADLIRRIQALQGTRHIHVMGHSFGAKVVAEAISMDNDANTNRKAKEQFDVAPVASMFLLEGAFSTWAFAGKGKNPYGTSIDGSVASVFDSASPKVTGVAVAGTSRWDYALRRVFPGGEYIDMIGQRLRHGRFPLRRTTKADKAIASLVGAVGTWGFSRDPGNQEDITMVTVNGKTQQYGFKPYRAVTHPYHLIMDDVVNLQPTTNIVTGNEETWGRLLSGAHSNIAHPEVAQAFWEAVTVSRTEPPPPLPKHTTPASTTPTGQPTIS